MRRIALVIACVVAGVPACTEEPSPVTVGMSVVNSNTAFFREMLTAARREARRQGARLLVSNARDNPTNQPPQVDRLLDQGVDALVIDAGGVSVAALNELAGEADVPVIAVGDTTPEPQATASVVSENVVAGRLAAEYLFFRMGGTGAAAAIAPSRLGPSDVEVQQGFEEIADRTPTVTITVQRTSEVDVKQAASIAAEVFESYPEVEGVLAGNDEIALGAVHAARRLGILGRVAIVGVGGSARALAAIEAGRLEGSVRTDPEELGRRAVEAAVRAARGEPVPRRQVVDVTLVTVENVKKVRRGVGFGGSNA
ncbi:MAG TPA: sugar ABC transporter substrate-binding protein [Actinomycetota bacterium]|nr:sugar ABC transporter substrate-binding protein [Actinomycetota bacterium]